MNIYDRAELSKQAKQFGFVRDTYEKVCRLSEILGFIENDTFLSNCLALKGGTAINLTILPLPRLSVDIDLDFAKNYSRQEIEEIKDNIVEKFHIFMTNKGYIFAKSKSKITHALHSWVFSYINTGGVEDNIKIEINYMLREHILMPEIRTVKDIPGFTTSKVLCINPVEIYGAKITALLSRTAARDLYDVNSMLEHKILSDQNKDLLRKCVIFYKILNCDEAFEKIDTSAIEKIPFSKIRSDLFPVIRSNEKKFDLPTTISFVKSSLEKILIMTPGEKEFISRFYQKEYKPELLFTSNDIVERLKNHPMIKWKLLNMDITVKKTYYFTKPTSR